MTAVPAAGTLVPARRFRGKFVDLNALLQLLNVFVLLLLVFAWWRLEVNEYIDHQTLVLGAVLSVQTHLALWIERHRRDPFVLLLAFWTIVYYSLRLFTLYLFPFSAVFPRFVYSAADSNYALIYILVANLFMYAGLYAVSIRRDMAIDTSDRRAAAPLAVLVLMLVTFMLTYFGGSYWQAGQVPRAVAVLVVLFSPSIIIPMVLAYYFLFRRVLSRSVSLAIGGLLLVELVAHTLWGSRSAFIIFIQTCMFVALAIHGTIRVRRKWVMLAIVMLPLGTALMVGAFAISTYNRMSKDSTAVLDVGQSLKLASEAGQEIAGGPALDVLLPPVLSRAGFFDYSAEVIAHREQYRPVINLTAYARSIIDNILTPGFDVFDQPKVANSMMFVYRGWGEPSKWQVQESLIYQSDQIGVYGEFYALFGYASLPLLFLLTWGLKRAYVRAGGGDPFLLAMKRVVILSFFTRTIDSFGFDWTIGEVLPLVVGVLLYSIIFRSERKSGMSPPARLNLAT